MAAPSPTRPRHAHAYRTPGLLSDIRLLDLLELCGSTRQAGQMLQLSQPTVSRRYRALASDFGLRDGPAAQQACRYGSTATMRLLRLSCRCHRLEAGVARLGSDLLHRGLLQRLSWLLPTPPHFRPVPQWLELVRQGVLDGALVSQLEIEQTPRLETSGLTLHRLGGFALALGQRRPSCGSSAPKASRVLVPDGGVAPGLRQLLRDRGWALKSVTSAGMNAEQWLMLQRRSGCALPIAAAAELREAWADGLEALSLPTDAISPVWLVLPEEQDRQGVLRQTLEQLRAHPALGS